MPAQHSGEGPSKRALVETAFDRFDDDLIADKGETDFAALTHAHRLGEVPGNQHAEATADPLHVASDRHGQAV